MIYDEKHKVDIIRDFLVKSADLFVEHISKVDRNRDEFLEAWYMTWRGFASHLPPFLKNSSFKQEGEWRVIVPIAGTDISNVFFRVSGNVLVPFVKLRLGEAREEDEKNSEEKNGKSQYLTDKLPIAKIFVGPNKSKDLAYLSARALLNKFEYFDTEIEVSGIPYRVG